MFNDIKVSYKFNTKSLFRTLVEDVEKRQKPKPVKPRQPRAVTKPLPQIPCHHLITTKTIQQGNLSLSALSGPRSLLLRKVF